MSVTTTPDPKDLKWKHYTGPVPAGAVLDAFTKPSFTLGNTKAVKDGEKYRLDKVDITLTMEKFLCWVKPDKKTDDLLGHERGHWSMQSVVAKEMESALAGSEEATIPPPSSRWRATSSTGTARTDQASSTRNTTTTRTTAPTRPSRGSGT